jgi:hypothetical protein
MRFSDKAYRSMKCICFGELQELKEMSFFATSTIPFKDWFTPVSFQYFCLVAQRCPIDKRHRVFLSDKSEQEFSRVEREILADIVEVHVISHFPCYLLTYDKLDEFFKKNSDSILKASDVKTFEKEKSDKKKLDFSIVELPNDIKILLLPRFPQKKGHIVEVEFYVNNKKSKKILESIAKGKLSDFFGSITFAEDIEKFQYYYRLKRLLYAAITNKEIVPLESGIR